VNGQFETRLKTPKAGAGKNKTPACPHKNAIPFRFTAMRQPSAIMKIYHLVLILSIV